jgi:hypothetical protein
VIFSQWFDAREFQTKIIMKFQFQVCMTWLREKAAKLTTVGFCVELGENAGPMRSLLLKIAGPNTEAELVVWESGATSMIVFNFTCERYDLDRHDISLVGDQYERDFEVFFNLLK